ncbi:MAG: vWA domain-containing protein [Candidatus Aminicenantes bacterium]
MCAKLRPIIPVFLFILIWTGNVIYGQKHANDINSIDIILLIDCSPSTKFTDPNNIRIQGARYFLEHLEETKSDRVTIRAGFANFGNDLGKIIPLGPLRADLSKSIRVEIIPFTDFRPPLKFARDEFRDKSDKSSKSKVVILFTDGSPQLTNRTLSSREKKQYFSGKKIKTDSTRYQNQKLNQLVQELKDMGTEIFVVARGKSLKDIDLWKEFVTPDNYLFIKTDEDVMEKFQKLWRKISGDRTIETTINEKEHVKNVSIQPYLEKIVFSFLKSKKNVKISLFNPGGRRIQPNRGGKPGDHYEIYSIYDPGWSNPWQIKIVGGEARLNITRLLPRLEVDFAKDNIQSGEKVTILAGLKRGKKFVIDSKLQITANIKYLMEESQWEYNLNDIGDGKYRITLEDLKKVGKYSAQLRASFDNKLLDAEFSKVEFDILEPPHAEPVIGWSKDSTITFLMILIIMMSVAFFFNYRKRMKIDLLRIPERGPLDEQIKEFEKYRNLKDQGDALLRNDNIIEAIEKYKLALVRLETYFRLGGNISSNEFGPIMGIMLNLLKENPKEQMELIYEHIQNDAPKWKIIEIANVFFNRWIYRFDYMINELYEILDQPKGMEVIEEISKIEIPSEWAVEKVKQGQKIVDLAQGYSKLGKNIKGDIS